MGWEIMIINQRNRKSRKVREPGQVTPCPGSLTLVPERSSFLRGSHHLLVANMLTHLFRGLSSRSALFSGPTTIQTASLVIARRSREIARATEPTHNDTHTGDPPQTTSNIGMEQITNILDNADLSKSPQSDNFSGKLLVPSSGQLTPTQCAFCP